LLRVTPQAPLETDALIVGAGPAGLFQVFQLGLLEIKAHVIDALPYPGGQCVELYADKPIYDIPSVPVCTGRELTQNLLTQIAPMGAQFHFEQVVTKVARQSDGRLLVGTSKGAQFLAKTVFIAGGVGAFQPKTLKVEGLDAFEGTQLAHHVADASIYANQRVVIVGDNDTALDWALRLCAGNPDGFPHKASHMTVVHRRDVFTAAPETVAKFRAMVAAGVLKFVVGQVTAVKTHADRLVAVQITQPDASQQSLALDQLLVLQGLSPKLGPIADWGMAMERRQLVVNTEAYATSEPGIFAVGDINTYPGKKKLILCAFHECVLAAFGAASVLYPDKKVLLEYTTTSSRLHKVLGLA
jgi:thioredoxin reductase (NADPH)